MNSPHRSGILKRTPKDKPQRSVSPFHSNARNLVAEIDDFLRKSQEDASTSRRISRSLNKSTERERSRSRDRSHHESSTHRSPSKSPYRSPMRAKRRNDIMSPAFSHESDSEYNPRPLLMEDLHKDIPRPINTNLKPTSPFSLKSIISPISPKSPNSTNRTVHINDEIEYINNSLLSNATSPPPSPPLLCETNPSDFQIECANLKRRIEALLNEPDKLSLLREKKLLIA